MSNSHVPRRLICATYTWSALLRSREHVFRPAKTLQRYPPPLSPSIVRIYRLTYDRFSRAFRITVAIFVQPRWEMIIFFFFFSFSLSKLNAATETEWKSIDQSREKKGTRRFAERHARFAEAEMWSSAWKSSARLVMGCGELVSPLGVRFHFVSPFALP